MSEAETFEDAWKAKYDAAPADDSTPVEEAAPAADSDDVVESAPAANAPEKSQEDPQDPPAQHKGESDADYRARYEALQHKVKSEEGRYSREVRERERLEKELQEMKARFEAQNASKASPDLDLDDIEVGEIEDFRKKYPDIAKGTVDDPKLAARWQKLLLERGEDEVIVTYETARGQASGAREEVMAELQRRDANAHLQAIEAAHPDWQSIVINPAPQHEQDIYHPEFSGWVGMLPMNVGQGVVWALQNGSAEQVNTVLKAFKEYRANLQGKAQPPRGHNKTEPPRSPQQQAAASAAMAVPTRGAPPPKSRPGGDASFEELWRAKYSK